MAIIAALILTSGCAISYPAVITDPEPSAIPTYSVDLDAPAGDEFDARAHEVTLYRITSSGELTSEERSLYAVDDVALLEESLNALFTEPDDAGAFVPIPSGTTLVSCAISNDIAIVNLSSQAATPELQQQMLALWDSIDKTARSIKSIVGTAVLIDGCGINILGMPIGLGTLIDQEHNEKWRQLLIERDLLMQVLNQDSADNWRMERYAAIYYPLSSGLTAPLVRPIDIKGDDYLSALIDGLRDPPLDSTAFNTAFVECAYELSEAPALITPARGGKRVAVLRFKPGLVSRRDPNITAQISVYASLCLSITHFLADIEGIVVYIGDEMVVNIKNKMGINLFPDGIMRPADFEGLMGSAETVYFTSAADGMLEPVECIVPATLTATPRVLLELLINGPPQRQSNRLEAVFPEGVSADDILGIRMRDGQISVHFSKNFLNRCQILTENEERNLVYAIVNTLTEINGVNQVCFYTDGRQPDTLAGSIRMHSPLMRNPLLISANGH
jgi:spore germination protein GerM